MRKAWFTAVLCTAAFVVVAPTSAHATGSPAYVTPGGYSTQPKGTTVQFRDLGAHITLTLAAGETHYINSVLYVGDAAEKTEVSQIAGCWPSGTTETLSNVLADSVAGTNVDAGVASVAQTSRFEFTPDTAGTYDCSLHAEFVNHTSTTTAGHIYVLSGSNIQDADGPLLAHAQAYQPGVILLSPAAGTTADLDLIASYTVPPGITAIDVIGDFEATNCYPQPGGVQYHICPVTGESTTADSTVVSRLYVQQLDTEGNVCHTGADTTLTKTVSPDTHHLKMYHRLDNFGIEPTCGSLNVKVYVQVSEGAGNDFEIETANESNSFLFEA